MEGNVFDENRITYVKVDGKKYYLPQKEYWILLDKLRQMDEYYRPLNELLNPSQENK